MIPDFKTYIGESVWADIHRRSNGSKERKEDDIDLMDGEDLCEYIKKNYITNSPFDVVFDKNFDDGCLIVNIYRWRNKYCYFILRKKNGINHIELTDIYNKHMKELISGYYYLYDDVEKEIYEIFPKDVERIDGLFPHYDKISNSFFIEVLDFLIKIADHSHIPQIRKKEKTFESVWADIHRRSNGEQVRKEDDVNHLSPDEFMDYLKSRYEKLDKKEFRNIEYVKSIIDTRPSRIGFPIERKHASGFTYTFDVIAYYNLDNENKIDYITVFKKYFVEDYPQFLDLIKDDYNIEDENEKITLKNGELKNSNVLDIIDKALSIVKKPLFRKIEP